MAGSAPMSGSLAKVYGLEDGVQYEMCAAYFSFFSRSKNIIKILFFFLLFST